jgi:hypothetical protein
MIVALEAFYGSFLLASVDEFNKYNNGSVHVGLVQGALLVSV